MLVGCSQPLNGLLIKSHTICWFTLFACRRHIIVEYEQVRVSILRAESFQWNVLLLNGQSADVTSD